VARWRREYDLAGLLDPVALGALTPAERRRCLALWADVDAPINRSGTSSRTGPPEPGPPAREVVILEQGTFRSWRRAAALSPSFSATVRDTEDGSADERRAFVPLIERLS
jgi:hypothetical protein